MTDARCSVPGPAIATFVGRGLTGAAGVYDTQHGILCTHPFEFKLAPPKLAQQQPEFAPRWCGQIRRWRQVGQTGFGTFGGPPIAHAFTGRLFFRCIWL